MVGGCWVGGGGGGDHGIRIWYRNVRKNTCDMLAYLWYVSASKCSSHRFFVGSAVQARVMSAFLQSFVAVLPFKLACRSSSNVDR